MILYFKVEGNQLIPAHRTVTIDAAEYQVMEDTKRYSVSEHASGNKWLIDFGYRQDARYTIICETAAELLYALGFVRTAFPATRSPRKVKS